MQTPRRSNAAIVGKQHPGGHHQRPSPGTVAAKPIENRLSDRRIIVATPLHTLLCDFHINISDILEYLISHTGNLIKLPMLELLIA